MIGLPPRYVRRRQSGWRKPPDAVYVGRPTEWGNPWAIGEPGPDGRVAKNRAQAVQWYADWLTLRDDLREKARRVLRGKPLTCWCEHDGPCHADVLVRVANVDPTAFIETVGRPRRAARAERGLSTG